MDWLYLFAFAVFAGVASGVEQECFEKKILECQKEINYQVPLCDTVPKIKTCLENAAVECKITMNPDMKQVLSALSDICNPESELGKLYAANQECIMIQSMPAIGPCTVTFLQEIQKLGVPDPNNLQEYEKKAKPVVCNNLPGMVSCGVAKVKDICKDGAEKLVRSITDPFLKYINVECGSGVTFTVNAFLLFIQLFAVLFSSKWFLN